MKACHQLDDQSKRVRRWREEWINSKTGACNEGPRVRKMTFPIGIARPMKHSSYWCCVQSNISLGTCQPKYVCKSGIHIEHWYSMITASFLAGSCNRSQNALIRRSKRHLRSNHFYWSRVLCCQILHQGGQVSSIHSTKTWLHSSWPYQTPQLKKLVLQKACPYFIREKVTWTTIIFGTLQLEINLSTYDMLQGLGYGNQPVRAFAKLIELAISMPLW